MGTVNVYDIERRPSGYFVFTCPACGETVMRRSPKITSRIAGDHHDRHEVLGD